MRTAFRKPALAALLALPAAAAVMLAQPAAAQEARIYLQVPGAVQPATVYHAPAPAIERFVMLPQGPLRPGTEVRLRVRGTPGASAWVTIPGEVRGLALREMRPGVYVGSHTLQRWGHPEGYARAFAVLRSGDRQAVARADLDDRFAQRDQQPPKITDVTPDHGQRVDDDGLLRIAASFTDDRSGIDPATVRLRIDGRDVTHRARIDADSVHYRDDLARGHHTAELVVSDRAGNTARTAWNFAVVDRDHGRWDDDRRERWDDRHDRWDDRHDRWEDRRDYGRYSRRDD